MPIERYFLDTDFKEGEVVFLEQEELHHLKDVMRAKVNQEVELINGRFELAQAQILEISRSEAKLMIESVRKEERSKNKPKLILCQALCRFNRLEFIIEKGTELNISQFWLFPGMLSEKKDLSETQKKRMFNLTTSALKQSGRLDLPKICFKSPLSQIATSQLNQSVRVVPTWPDAIGKEEDSLKGLLLFGDTRKHAPLLFDLYQQKLHAYPSFLKLEEKSIYLFIGPEKGFHPKEIDILENTLQSFGIKLQELILRVDTAAITGASLLQHFLLII